MRHYLTQFLSQFTPCDGANNDVSVWWVRARNSVDKNGMPIAKNSFPIVGVILRLLSLLWSTFFPCTEHRRSTPKTLDSRLLSRETISFYSFNFIIKRKIRIVSLTNRIPAEPSPVEWVMGWVYIKYWKWYTITTLQSKKTNYDCSEAVLAAWTYISGWFCLLFADERT